MLRSILISLPVLGGASPSSRFERGECNMAKLQVYTKDFFKSLQPSSRSSAMAIVPIVLELIQPKSVVDVGCGTGEWLNIFKECGVEEILGIDGEYVDRSLLVIPQENFKPLDISRPFILDKIY